MMKRILCMVLCLFLLWGNLAGTVMAIEVPEDSPYTPVVATQAPPAKVEPSKEAPPQEEPEEKPSDEKPSDEEPEEEEPAQEQPTQAPDAQGPVEEETPVPEGEEAEATPVPEKFSITMEELKKMTEAELCALLKTAAEDTEVSDSLYSCLKAATADDLNEMLPKLEGDVCKTAFEKWCDVLGEDKTNALLVRVAADEETTPDGEDGEGEQEEAKDVDVTVTIRWKDDGTHPAWDAYKDKLQLKTTATDEGGNKTTTTGDLPDGTTQKTSGTTTTVKCTLPNRDEASGNALSYAIVADGAPEGYVMEKDDTGITYTLIRDVEVAVTIRWNDNVNDENTRPDWEGYKGKLKLQVTTTDLDGNVTTETIDLPADAVEEITGASTATVKCTLPDHDKDTYAALSYAIVADGDPDGYVTDSDDKGITYTQTMSVSFNVQTVDGAKTEGGRFPDLVGEEGLDVSVRQGSDVVSNDGTWSGFDSGTGIGQYTFDNLRKYDSEGNELEYNAVVNSTTVTLDGDPFAVTYDNTSVPNHGSDTANAAENGIIKLTLKDTTTYSATKYWLDDNNPENRPTAAFTLWRYTDRKDGSTSYRTASPAYGADGGQITITVDGTGEGTVTNLEGGAALDKYDALGYEYIYFTRESMAGGAAYEQVFDPAVTVTDGEATSITSENRADDIDKSIYNGGSIANRISGTVEVTSKKSWKAASYIDQLGQVEVTMTLMKRPTGDDNAAWTTSGIEQTHKGFSSATPYLEYTAEVSQYDELGRELEYQWVETAVLEGGVNVLDTDGSITLKINERNSWPEDRTDTIGGFEFERQNVEYFTSKQEDDGNVTNELHGEVDYIVQKVWKDEEGNVVDGPEDATATIIIMNNKGFPSKTVVLDGSEDTPWVAQVKDLPKYTASGAHVGYTVREVDVINGYVSNIDNDAVNRITVVTNQPGEGFTIPIQKNWVDDDDAGCRYPCEVEIWYRDPDTGAEERVVGTTLNTANAWYLDCGIPKDFCGPKPKEGEPENPRWDRTNYFIKEVSLNGGAYTVNGDTVTTDSHKYVVSYGQAANGTLMVTNRRVGIVDITVTKTWKDKGADYTQRPDATFNLSVTGGTGVSLTEGTDADTGAVTADGVTTVNLPTIIELDKTPEAGVVTEYKFEGLPKYDKNGRVISYAVSENWVDGADASAKNYVMDSDWSYVPEKIKADSAKNSEEHDLQTVTFTNSREATRSVTFYKEWNDDYALNNGNRPDIFVNLYGSSRYNDAGELEGDAATPESMGFKTNAWSAAPEHGENALRYWKVTFDDQPMYDEDGNVITYYAKESANGDISGFDYQDPSYQDDTQTETTDGEWVTTATDGATVVKEGGTFVNGVRNTVKLIGKKVWKDIPDGYTGEMPTITVGVKRHIEGGEEEVLIPKLTKIKTPKGTTSVQFTFYHEDGKETGDTHYDTSLEKYDDEGHLYIYSFDESIDMESRTPGIDLNDLVTGSVDSNMVITNTFPSSNYLASLSLSKDWKNRPNNLDDLVDQYPATTFTIYRIYVGTDGTEKEEEVGTQEIQAADWKKAGTLVSFTNLPIFAPDGFKYIYYVTEESIDGYTYVEDINTNVTKIEGSAKYAFTFNQSGAEGKTAPVEGAGTVTNTYVPDTFNLTGTKVWDDQDNTFQTRPDIGDAEKAMGLTLYRYAQAQNGQDNAIASAADPVEVENAVVEWTQNANDPNKWNYSYKGLDVWAYNGMPWIYIVKENLSDDYNVNYPNNATWDAVTAAVSDDPNAAQFAGERTNSLTEAIQVTKEWEDENFAMRPDVVFDLQVKIDGTWYRAADTEPFASAKAPDDLTGWVYEDIEAGTIHTTVSSPKWEKLPAQVYVDDAWQDVSYRFVETKIGEHAVFTDAADALADPIVYPTASNGQYTPSQEKDGAETTIKNTLQGGYTTLSVLKVWNDQQNAYSTRPADLTLNIEVSADSGASWSNMLDDEGNACTITLNAGSANADTNWETVVTQLPLYNDAGNALIYRAVENTTPNGYAHEVKDDVHAGAAADGFSSQITNVLSTSDLGGTKTWVSSGNVNMSLADTQAQMVLTIKQNGKTFTYKGNANGQPTWTEENGVYTYSYTDMPSFDKQGNPCTYTVTEATVPGYVGAQTDNDFTNTITALTLEKTDAYNGDKLSDDNLVLTITDKNNVTVATWTRAEGEDAAFTVAATTGDYINLTTENGVLYGLPVGTYTVTETSTPEDYQTAAAATVTVENANTKDAPAELTVEDTPKPTKITFKKYDAVAGGKFGGAVFTLTKADDADFSKTISSTTGDYELDGLTPGTYTLTETTHPTGYPDTITDNLFECTFVVEHDDMNQTLVIADGAAFVTKNGGAWYSDGIANYPNRIDIAAKKVWADDNDRDGIRPGSVTVGLLAGTTDTGKSTTLNDGNNWEDTTTFVNLPEYANGVEITYNLSETAPNGYTASYSGDKANGLVVTNTHTPETTKIAGEKTWDDNNDQDGKRPTSITVHLFANGAEVQKKTVTAADGWKWEFTDLKYYNHGTEITYTITEDKVTDYNDPAVDGFDVTNKHDIIKTSVPVSKTWVDDTNRDGIRPASVTVTLYANGTATDKTLELNTGNGFADTFTDVDMYYNHGQLVNYTVVETAVNGYTASYAKDDKGAITVTNTHTPETVKIAGEKTWDDNNDQDGKRPTSITVHLLANGTEVQKKTVTAADGWKWEFTDLKYYDEGKTIVYTITEDTVTDYNTPAVDGYNVTNKHDIIKIDVPVSKSWDDDNNRDGIRPDSVTVTLYANGVSTGKTLTLEKDKDNFTGKFESVDKYSGGKEINYSVQETAVTDYTPSYAKDAATGAITVTNTHELIKTKVPVEITWTDDSNRDGVRPDSVTVTLYKNGVATDKTITITADKDGNWKGEFDDLDMYKEGEVGTLNQYTVLESTVTDYTTEKPEGTGDMVNGFTIENVHTPETTKITGEKVWDDNDDQDGLRPGGKRTELTSITINLLANGAKVQTKTVTPDEDGNWKWEFTDLKYYDEGQEIVYTFTEEAVANYTTTVNGTTVTNKHDIITRDIPVEITWDDDDNRDGVRPDSVTVTLYKNGVATDTTITVTKDDPDSWKDAFKGLDMYEDGVEIEYTVLESTVTDYTTEKPEGEGDMVNGFTIENVHTPETTKITGEKVWDDNDDQDGLRPGGKRTELTSITINLLANGAKVQTKTVTPDEDGNWKWEFTDLKYYDEGQEIAYTFTEEAVANYTTTVNGTTVTNKHDIITRDIPVEITWDDDDNRDNVRPDSVIVTLYKNGVATDTTITVTKDDPDSWKDAFKGLDMYEDGVEIQYTVLESTVTDYTTEKPEGTGDMVNGFTIENVHTPETTNIEGGKTWDDDNNRDNVRPDSITIRLYANDTEVQHKEVKPDEKGNWTWKFTDLKYDEGKEIVYTITEDEVTNYTGTVNGFNVTNKHELETTKIAGEKVWDDNDDQDGLRPGGKRTELTSITINLLANGTKVQTKTVTPDADGNWKWEFTDLKYYDEGQEIAYTFTEEAVAEYTTTVDGTTVTNTHEIIKRDIPVNITWDDDDDRDRIRPDEVTVTLYKNGVATDKTITVTKDDPDSWKDAFKDLDMYEDGEEIEYTVVQDGVKDYDTKDATGDMVNGFTIDNVHEPETTEIKGSKTWDDNDDQDGLRPGGKRTEATSITVHLFANGTEVQEKTVTADDGWEWSFTDLKYEEGEEITYTVTEDAVEGYTTTVNGYDVTNTHEIIKRDIPVNITWDDDDDRDRIRPDEVTVTLYKNGVATDKTITITKDNPDSWKNAFKDLDMYEDGEEIEYTVVQDGVKDYDTKDATGDMVNGFTIDNVHEPETTEIKGSKTWDDNDDQDGLRPGGKRTEATSITVHLFANGTEVQEKTVTADDGWEWSFTDLKYEEGEEITYTVTEDAVEGYTTTVNGYDVTNTHEIIKRDIPVNITWDDDDDRDRIRPDEVTVTLYKNGVATDKTITVTKDDPDSWKDAFKDLDMYEDGEEIEYTVVQDGVKDYDTKDATGDMVNGFTIDNVHEPVKTTVTVVKNWNDEDNRCNNRTASVTVRLYADGTPTGESLSLNEDNGWTDVFENLNKFNKGEEIVYTVTEDAVTGYSTEIVGDAPNSFTITNTPTTTSVSVTKVWKDMSNRYHVRPSKVTMVLYANGTKTEKTLIVNSGTEWKGTFTDLDEYRDGAKVVYTVQEEKVSKYKADIKGDAQEGFTVTNTVTVTDEDLPKTGDEYNPVVWMTLMGASALVGITILLTGKKKKRK